MPGWLSPLGFRDTVSYRCWEKSHLIGRAWKPTGTTTDKRSLKKIVISVPPGRWKVWGDQNQMLATGTPRATGEQGRTRGEVHPEAARPFTTRPQCKERVWGLRGGLTSADRPWILEALSIWEPWVQRPWILEALSLRGSKSGGAASWRSWVLESPRAGQSLGHRDSGQRCQVRGPFSLMRWRPNFRDRRDAQL